MMRFLKLSTSLNTLTELASLAYDIRGPRSDKALAKAVAALKDANPTLKKGISRGITIRVPRVPGLKPSDKTEPAVSAYATRIDALAEMIETYEASLNEKSAQHSTDLVKRLKLVKSEKFFASIRDVVLESTQLIKQITNKIETDGEKDGERNEQIQKALERMKEDLQIMRKRVS